MYWSAGASAGGETSKRYFVGMLLKKLAGVPYELYPLAHVTLLIEALTYLRGLTLAESALRTVK